MDLFEYDKAEGVQLLCGVDEAGRGPLAGDVYAAAVILPQDIVIEGLNDSKKLSEKKRELLYDEIIEKAVDYCVGVATIEEIDKFNILGATFLAMNRAVGGLKVTPKLVLVDGNQNPKLSVHSRCVVKGDATSASIAAASILAKVSRDRYMKEVATAYPQYQFEKHKGYGTPLHYKMLDEYGVSKVHRLSFLKKYLSGDEHISQIRGRLGEQIALDTLMQKGYSVIARNYSSPYGELDIVAKQGDCIVVVEVKARGVGQTSSAADAVTKSKRDKIIKTTAYFLREHSATNAVRFDVFEVYFDGDNNEISRTNHIENAFSGDGSYVFV